MYIPPIQRPMKDFLTWLAGATIGTFIFIVSNIPLALLVALLSGICTVVGKHLGEQLLAKFKSFKTKKSKRK